MRRLPLLSREARQLEFQLRDGKGWRARLRPGVGRFRAGLRALNCKLHSTHDSYQCVVIDPSHVQWSPAERLVAQHHMQDAALEKTRLRNRSIPVQEEPSVDEELVSCICSCDLVRASVRACLRASVYSCECLRFSFLAVTQLQLSLSCFDGHSVTHPLARREGLRRPRQCRPQLRSLAPPTSPELRPSSH